MAIDGAYCALVEAQSSTVKNGDNSEKTDKSQHKIKGDGNDED